MARACPHIYIRMHDGTGLNPTPHISSGFMDVLFSNHHQFVSLSLMVSFVYFLHALTWSLHKCPSCLPTSGHWVIINRWPHRTNISSSALAQCDNANWVPLQLPLSFYPFLAS